MFLKEELDATRELCERKIEDILDPKSTEEFTAESLRNLQTLVKLKNAAEEKTPFDPK